MSDAERASWRAPLVALGVVAVVSALVLAHAPGLNGPWYWKWPWRRLPALRVFGLLLVALAPFARAIWIFHVERPAHSGKLLALVSASSLALQIVGAGVQSQPFSLTRIWRVILHPGATSYFTDAAKLAGNPELLREFPQRLPELRLHSKNKPPGPLLFHRTQIALFGPNLGAALAAGLAIALLAAATPAAAFAMARGFGADRATAFHTAALLSLCPGLLYFFPELDQVYPLFTCGVLGAWVWALRTGRLAGALLAALAFCAASFFTYSALVLGAFLIAYTAIGIARGRAARVAQALALAVAVVAAFYAVLFLAFGFDPIATFRVALVNQAELAAILRRPYAPALLFDPLDFALGMGWLPIALALIGVARPPRDGSAHDSALAWLCLGQVAVVAVSGLLRCEAARVWIFLYPLVAFVAARELASWTALQQRLGYTALALFGGVVLQNMIFLDV